MFLLSESEAQANKNHSKHKNSCHLDDSRDFSNFRPHSKSLSNGLPHGLKGYPPPQEHSALPRIAVREECSKGELCFFNIRNVELSRKFCYALHKDKGMTPVLEAWIDTLSSHAGGYPAPLPGL